MGPRDQFMNIPARPERHAYPESGIAEQSHGRCNKEHSTRRVHMFQCRVMCPQTCAEAGPGLGIRAYYTTALRANTVKNALDDKFWDGDRRRRSSLA